MRDARAAVYGVWICAGWFLAGTVLAAFAMTWQTASSLETFGAHALTGSVVILSFLRLFGPKIAAVSVLLAVVFASHPSDRRIPYAAFAAIPPLALAAAALAAPVSMGVAALVSAVPPAVFWTEVARYVRPGDVLFGFGRGCAYALALAASVHFVLRWLQGHVQSGVAKVLVSWLAAAAVTAPIDFGIELFAAVV
jgi:ABC-type transporter Mla maintaining outer membrane lipid asymmetry permease subunit MlaE